MLSDELRKRLTAMSGGPPSTPGYGAPDSPALRQRLTQAAIALETRHARVPPPATLEALCGGHPVETPEGVFYLIEPSSETLHPNADGIVRHHLRLCPGAADHLELPLPDYRPLCAVAPERLLYVDIETTGFTSVPLFLIGLMYVEDDRLRVSQLLARDYSEEAAVLYHLAERLDRYDCLITFNGKTFDMPYIRDRYFASAIRCRFPTKHLDLLGLSRRRWRKKLPDCRLQTLERWVCGRNRNGDIPGRDIPETYRLFVQTQNAGLIKPILDHNALDLITMGDLLVRLLE
ncbi:MAG: ribonuclease H-like domain-containing protein [candidate division Zixibacteria bacterium]|nr:ribonuclease H-like domain-containing protein [candidate division Zixibacteria bacterium]